MVAHGFVQSLVQLAALTVRVSLVTQPEVVSRSVHIRHDVRRNPGFLLRNTGRLAMASRGSRIRVKTPVGGDNGVKWPPSPPASRSHNPGIQGFVRR